MDAASKPYDITDIPFFPYVPGWAIWVGVAVAAIALNLLIRRMSGLASTDSSLKAYEIADSELRASLLKLKQLRDSSPEVSRSIAARAALIVRRFVSVASGAELSTLSANELITLAPTIGPRYFEMLKELAALEELRYNPAANKDSVTTSLEKISRLLMTMQQREAQQK